ncbi:MAG TPA: MBL fold metallo-hydrolase [Bacteroidales bacterium]|nr:MBL fold metallo-hydrolase [Bacteroidales bacterium]
MEITLLGTGTSQGVPVVACDCQVCNSDDPLDKRLRTSAMVRQGATCIVIDAGPDFRQQLLRERVKNLDAVILTHGHKDHIGGIDDVRSFNWVQGRAMDIYGTEEVLKLVKNDFGYAFAPHKYPGVPDINLHTIDYQPFSIGELEIMPIKAMHHLLPVLGFRIGDFSYLTDANHLESHELDKMRNSQVLVINALRRKKHLSHFNLEEALGLIKELSPKIAFLTHLSHQMGLHKEIQRELPPNVFVGYDGLSFRI